MWASVIGMIGGVGGAANLMLNGEPFHVWVWPMLVFLCFLVMLVKEMSKAMGKDKD